MKTEGMGYHTAHEEAYLYAERLYEKDLVAKTGRYLHQLDEPVFELFEDEILELRLAEKGTDAPLTREKKILKYTDYIVGALIAYTGYNYLVGDGQPGDPMIYVYGILFMILIVAANIFDQMQSDKAEAKLEKHKAPALVFYYRIINDQIPLVTEDGRCYEQDFYSAVHGSPY